MHTSGSVCVSVAGLRSLERGRHLDSLEVDLVLNWSVKMTMVSKPEKYIGRVMRINAMGLYLLLFFCAGNQGKLIV